MKKALILSIGLLAAGHQPVRAQAKQDSIVVLGRKVARVQYGIASYYSDKFQGRRTRNDEIYDKNKLTAAHNGVPLGTWIRVTNLRNGRSVIVRVNDRLYYKNKRLVDLSRAAATRLGYIGRGLTRVKVEVLGSKKPRKTARKHPPG